MQPEEVEEEVDAVEEEEVVLKLLGSSPACLQAVLQK